MGKGMDVVVYGKHWLSIADLSPFKKRVFDVCDDHFNGPHDAYYREHIAKADLVTCNSEAMKETIRRETDHIATVIPDPYESDEQEAGYGQGVLWYGHESNLKTIEPYRGVIDRVLTHPEWSRENQVEAIKECAIVVIPTDERKGKSANRLIEAVRNGRFVVGGDLPSHNEFKDMMWIGDIKEGIEWVKTHPEECIKRVKQCQDYIRDRFSPEHIGQLWLETLQTLEGR